MQDVHEERVLSGKAWEEYCDTLKAAGAAMVFQGTPRDSFNQAEGYRYLSRLTRAGLEAFVEYADPKNPQLRRMVTETIKLGCDNPDNCYQNCSINGTYSYKLSGNRSNVHYLAFATQKADYMKGGNQVTGVLEASDMYIEPNGDFEIIVSVEKPADAKNWLPVTIDSRILLVRQTFLDRSTEVMSDVKVTRIGADKYPDPIDCKTIDEGLNNAGLFVAGSSLFFAKWANDWKKHTNTLPQHDPAISGAAGGDPNIAYYHSYWDLKEDEAMIVEFTPPQCDYWNFHLNNHWLESLDYRYFNITLNKHSARAASDGSVRIVVAHQDPHCDNWIHTAYHHVGTFTLRWVKANDYPPVNCRVVKFTEINP